jgi:hypothetical protein
MNQRRKIIAIGSLFPFTFNLAGCAIVPSLEEDTTFSYRDILAQIECETYDAIEHITSTMPKKDGKPWTDLSTWSVDITLNPARYLDEQIGIGGSNKTVAKAGSYFQWTIGGTNAVPGGPSYESYGTSNAKNDWVLKLLSLYSTHPDPKDPKKLVMDKASTPNGYRPINRNLHCDARPSVASSNRLPDSFSEGFFGIEGFLERSVDAGENIWLDPKTIVFTKEYKKRIQIGVTPGWYVTAGNTSPAIGGYGYIDNIITLSFSPPAPPAGPIPVYEVPNPNKVAKAVPGRPAPQAAVAPARSPAANARGFVPADAATSERLTGAAGAASILQKLNQLPQQ